MFVTSFGGFEIRVVASALKGGHGDVWADRPHAAGPVNQCSQVSAGQAAGVIKKFFMAYHAVKQVGFQAAFVCVKMDEPVSKTFESTVLELSGCERFVAAKIL